MISMSKTKLAVLFLVCGLVAASCSSRDTATTNAVTGGLSSAISEVPDSLKNDSSEQSINNTEVATPEETDHDSSLSVIEIDLIPNAEEVETPISVPVHEPDSVPTETFFMDVEEQNWPIYDENTGAEAYFRELLGWMLYGSSLEDDFSKEAVQCYIDIFVDMFDGERLTGLVETLTAQDSNLGGPWDKLPADLLTPDEKTSLLDTAKSCLHYEDMIDLDAFLGGPVPIENPETRIALTEAARYCRESMMNNDTFVSAILELAVFETGVFEDAIYMSTLMRECGESFFVPLYEELLVVEAGVGREAAECFAPHVLDIYLMMSSIMVAVPPVADSEIDRQTEELLDDIYQAGEDCGIDPLSLNTVLW